MSWHKTIKQLQDTYHMRVEKYNYPQPHRASYTLFVILYALMK